MANRSAVASPSRKNLLYLLHSEYESQNIAHIVQVRIMSKRNYLIEGTSGTGKTSVAEELQRRGYHVLHGDRELKYRGDPQTGEPVNEPVHQSEWDKAVWQQQHGSGLTRTDLWYHPGNELRSEMPLMIAHTCRRCGSARLRKNGRTRSGQQKLHCKDCNFYGTLDTKEHERSARQAIVEKLHIERLSQRAIARTSGMSRMTIAKMVKKKS